MQNDESVEYPKMSSECHQYHSQYIYHSSAYAIAGEFYRPLRKQLPTQGAAVLGVTGGYSCNSLSKFSLDCLVSFENACVEVGGSYDECHDVQTSYFSTVIEGLNIANMLTADRVVARMMVYSPKGDHGGEHTFDITGSHFENLKIAGHQIKVELDTGAFHNLNTYSKFTAAYKGGQADHLLLFNKFGALTAKQRHGIEDQFHALHGLSGMIDALKADKTREPKDRYLCSAVSHLDLKDHVAKNSELRGYGAVICIPKFGAIRLGEILVTKQFRSLTMFTVQMGSVGSGSVSGGSGSTGGGNGLP
jgi:hypothetical protein